jgi:nuclear GTP-binding protein
MAKTRKGDGKKKITDKVKSGKHSMNPDRESGKGGANMRSKATIERLRMYKNSKPVRDRTGKIIKQAPFQGWQASGTRARVEPNRKWFGKFLTIHLYALFLSSYGILLLIFSLFIFICCS